MSFIQLNYEIFKNIKYFFSNEKNITMDVVSVAERSDDRRSSTTKSKSSEACWGLLRITTHIQKDDVGVQRNMILL